MKTKIREYTIVPSVFGRLQDKVSLYKAVYDDPQDQNNQTLETYFNDIYHLFLNKLVKVTHQVDFSHEESKKLKTLLDEIIRVKALLDRSE